MNDAMNAINRIVIGLAVGAVVLPVAAEDAVTWDTWPDTWVAVDELGREVASSDGGVTRDGVDENTSVGMFYYLWHGQHNDSRKDISVLLQENPDNPDWGTVGYMHWGSKPWLGYYNGGDPYVIAKHIQMLVDAGIDWLFFDCTNAEIYPANVQAVIYELINRDKLGMKYPKLAFMVHSAPAGTMTKIYNRFYRTKPEYEKFWYKLDGKPLALAPLDELGSASDELKGYFTFRNSWAWRQKQYNLPKEWSWLEYYPQKPGWTNKYDPESLMTRKMNEQISVSVAQHATTKVGKSYHSGKQPAIDKYGMCKDTPRGLYFQEQWNEALRVHPPVVMVTQFNEWIAQRFVINSTSQYGDVRPGATAKIGESYFVDVYSPEFSRDLEPSAHPSVRDNYYLQLVSNVRKYRGVNKIPVPTKSFSIALQGDFSQWDAETVEFRDDKEDCVYTSKSVQTPETLERETNDIIRAKVTKDSDFYYFYVETMEPLTPFETSDRWMRLLINSACDYTKGWHGYDYMVAKDEATGKYSLMKNAEAGKFEWNTVEAVDFRVASTRMHLMIPRTLIEGHAGVEKDFDFKWADNISGDNPDIMTFISDGDVAPNGRFNYRYKGSQLKSESSAVESVVASREMMPEINAVSGGVTVRFPGCCGKTDVDVCDTLGRRIRSVHAIGEQEVFIALPQGMAIVRWANESASGSKAVVVR